MRLAAYVVPAGPGLRPEAGELRDALRRVLPELIEKIDTLTDEEAELLAEST